MTDAVAEVVLDASALLAILLGEPGGEVVRPHLLGAVMSAVNYSEVLDRTARLTGSLESARRNVDRQRIEVVPFDAEQAAVAASLVPTTRTYGLSLGDRSCLALGVSRGATVLTADQVWAKLNLDVPIVIIR